jgi:hypothetical protein
VPVFTQTDENFTPERNSMFTAQISRSQSGPEISASLAQLLTQACLRKRR